MTRFYCEAHLTSHQHGGEEITHELTARPQLKVKYRRKKNMSYNHNFDISMTGDCRGSTSQVPRARADAYAHKVHMHRKISFCKIVDVPCVKKS